MGPLMAIDTTHRFKKVPNLLFQHGDDVYIHLPIYWSKTGIVWPPKVFSKAAIAFPNGY